MFLDLEPKKFQTFNFGMFKHIFERRMEMKHWKVDYASKFGDVIFEDSFVVTAPCIREAVSIAANMLEFIGDGIPRFIWNVGIIEEELF